MVMQLMISSEFREELETLEAERIEIRTMKLADVKEVAALERTIFKDPWSEQSFEYEVVDNKLCFALVAVMNGRVIGYSVCWRIADEMHLANIAVSPNHRRKGVGKKLLEIALEEAHRGRCNYVHLEVRKSNRAAISLYEKFDFKKVAIRPRYYRCGEDAILMEKVLDQEPDLEFRL